MNEFDELKFWTIMKRRPAMYLGKKSIVRLETFLNGISYALNYNPGRFPYFSGFNDWYMKKEKVDTQRGYVIWWNHILYTNGNMDDEAFDSFLRYFEEYLKEVHNVIGGIELKK